MYNILVIKIIPITIINQFYKCIEKPLLNKQESNGKNSLKKHRQIQTTSD